MACRLISTKGLSSVIMRPDGFSHRYFSTSFVNHVAAA
jgi:hypothetical protein